MISHLLYLHGFRSSPKSHKAQFLAGYLQENYPTLRWHCPQLPESPRAASLLIKELTKDWSASTGAVMGSSLGGFYADWLSAERGFKCVLINPATDPARDLALRVGMQTVWQEPEKSIQFKMQYLDELKALYPLESTRPDVRSKLLMYAPGDEVLSWQEMVLAHPNAQHYKVLDSDHAMTGFELHVGAVIDFLGI